MKITAITVQTRDKNRVNISVDGVYRFSLGIYQLVDLGVKVGREYDETELVTLEQESQFGKIYSRALEYCLMRPHSVHEVKDYLCRKIRPTLDRSGKQKPGIAPEFVLRVLDRVIEEQYVDDERFAHYWIENRSLVKGVSRRKLVAELHAKGVDDSIINKELSQTDRNDHEEIRKIIIKKRSRYPDDRKLTMYLVRLGFRYDDIKRALSGGNEL
jgi:regulatory protein